MKTAFFTQPMRRTAFIGGIFTAAAIFVSPGISQAAEPKIYLIEEDWELVVNDPDPASNSPQITFFTSPTTSDNDYFQLQMNYHADTEYSSGGFHVGAIHQSQMIDEARSQTRKTISTDGDRIRWTSVMAVFDGKFHFAVKDGHGDEWGDFGGPDYLVRMPAEGVTDLSGYHPQVSLDAVDIGFGRNRVASLILKRVRVVYTNGDIVTVPVDLSP